MIRPVTCVCFLLACGSGLYVYQSKHRVQLLDREIEQTVHATDALREQTRVAHAEWTLLNDPQRLQALADQFLSLKTVAPAQFTSMAELENRLPAVSVPEPAPQEPFPLPVAEPPPPIAAAPPPAPSPASKPAVVAAVPPAVRVPEHKPAPPRPAVAEAPPVRPQPAVHPVVAADLVRPVAPRVVAASLPAQPSAAPAVGSALGMARGAGVPPPQPVPVSASQWVTNGGGG
jgi:hypothetical protein